MKRHIFRGVLFLILLGTACTLSSQDFHLAFQHLSQSDGLSEGINPYVFKDSRGYVWISSLEGLNRFDGKSVKVYKRHPQEPHSLAGNLVSSNFFEDKAGDIWFTTHEAIQCYRRAKDHFDSYLLSNNNGDTIKADYYAFHLDSAGKFWVRTDLEAEGRLHLFDTQTYKDSIVCPLDGHRNHVVLNEKREVAQVVSSLFQHGLAGIEITDFKQGGTPQKRILFREDQKEGLPKLYIKNIYVESDTLLWMGSVKGLIAFNPVKNKVRIFSSFQGENVNRIWSIVPYEKNYLFVSSANDGILVFEKSQQKFIQKIVHRPDINSSLRDNEVRELYLDDQQNLWVSIWAYGLDYVNLKKNKFGALLQKENIEAAPTHIFGIAEMPSGNILCGTGRNKGLYLFSPDKKKIDHFLHDPTKPTSPPPYSIVQLYTDRSKKVWVLSRLQLHLFNEDQATFQTVETAPQSFRHITQLSNGELLVSSIGIKTVVEESGKLYVRPHPDLLDFQSDFYTIYQDANGIVYLAENGKNLLLFKEEKGHLVLQKRLDGLGNCHAFYEAPNDSLLWIASSYGLLKMNKNRPEEYEVLSEEKGGIPAENYYSLLADAQNQFWLSCNNGLIKYNPTTQSHHRYSTSDGLQGNEFNEHAAFASSSGEFWFGGLNGLNVFHPEKVQAVPYTPSIQFKRLLVNDETYATENNLDQLQKLDLEYTENTISFELAALEYSYSAANQFKYKMEGIDKDWIFDGTRGFARYPNLPPGLYRFDVMAANSDGVWNDNPKSIQIRIRAPFWQKWWFYLLLLALLYLLIRAWFQYRLQQALKIERLRVKISSDLHDDVGTILSGLAMQTEVMELTAKDSDKARLQRIAGMSRNAMSRMRDTVWAIDARKDKLENLLDRIREHGEENLSPRNIRFQVNHKNLDLKVKLPTQVRQNLYLICKEAITNIGKHSNATEVEILLHNKGAIFEMYIKDNGSVQEKSYKTTGLGMSNIKLRATQIEAQIEVIRKEGFCIYLQRQAI